MGSFRSKEKSCVTAKGPGYIGVVGDGRMLKDHRSTIEAILDLQQSFGSQVTAEGVQTKAQLDYLLALGCSDQQGYLFGEPAPITDLSKEFSDLSLSGQAMKQVSSTIC